ncbi:MAG: ATP-binding protein [Pseudoflavonifractor sp.]|nr:ATP-binding protein [Pseudoflavonifractor sp.]
MKWQVSLNNDSFDRAGITKDCKDAMCEYIWNGFEAGATNVKVILNGSPLKEAMSIQVIDNGVGIPFDNLEETFGAFLSSVKNDTTIRIKSQVNKGKGRFSYLCFSPSAEWTTVFDKDGKLNKYIIKTDSINRSEFDTTEPEQVDDILATGTSVEFPLSDSSITDQLSYSNMRQKLLEEFAWFLYLNRHKELSLEYMGIVLDASQYINTDLCKNCIENIYGHNFDINVIVWKSNVSNSSKIYYLAEHGEIVAAQNTTFNKNKVGFYHAVFVSSEYFKAGMFFPPEDESDQIEIEPQNDQRNILRQLKKRIVSLVADALKSFLVLQADIRLANMEKRGTMPRFSDDEYGALRKKDFETVTRELYCVEPRIFYKLNDTQEKSLLGFLNLLLSSEERENVLQIIEQVVNLTPEQRKSFAEVLQRSQLQYIIEAISTIEKRVAVVEELKRIVFDLTSFANERNHIQKIIEQHFWLFGEQYHMLTADKNMKTSLEEFEKITECFDGAEKLSMTEKDALQRIDVFLYSQRVQEDSSSEMLVIELKAPYVKLSLDVFNQIVRYANTIRKEPRFTSSNRIWKFFAICSEVEDDVKIKYKNFEQYGKKGLADVIGNFELYALSWDDVFQSFESRHSFLLDKLKLDFSQVSSELGVEGGTSLSRAEVTELTQKLLALKAQ